MVPSDPMPLPPGQQLAVAVVAIGSGLYIARLIWTLPGGLRYTLGGLGLFVTAVIAGLAIWIWFKPPNSPGALSEEQDPHAL